jgi:hypothetical protein
MVMLKPDEQTAKDRVLKFISEYQKIYRGHDIMSLHSGDPDRESVLSISDLLRLITDLTALEERLAQNQDDRNIQVDDLHGCENPVQDADATSRVWGFLKPCGECIECLIYSRRKRREQRTADWDSPDSRTWTVGDLIGLRRV